MKPSIETKLQSIVARYEELKSILSDSKVTQDLNRYRDLSREFSQVEHYVQMYMRYAESQRWKIEVMSESHGEHGGYKEVIMRVIGQGAYSRFKFESGVHRVQRVPDTEAQGRIHTSTCTVAILPELEEIESID